MFNKKFFFVLIFPLLLFIATPVQAKLTTPDKSSVTNVALPLDPVSSTVDAGKTSDPDLVGDKLYFDPTDVERVGALTVFSSDKSYMVSKKTFGEKEKDSEGKFLLRSIELELQITWKTRKIIENKEDINVYKIDESGNFVLVKAVKYGEEAVELSPYEYLEEDVLRYKGEPDPNFNLKDYLPYANGKIPTFRLRVQDKFRDFIEANSDLVSAIKTLVEEYGYKGCEVSYFKSLVTKETNDGSNLFLKNITKKKFWKDVIVDPKIETSQSKKNSRLKFRVAMASSIGVYFYKFHEHYFANLKDHPASVVTFTLVLGAWTVGKELMYSTWMSSFSNFYDKVKTLGRNTDYFQKWVKNYKPQTAKTLSELWSMRIMILQTGILLAIENAMAGAIDYGTPHLGAEFTSDWWLSVISLKVFSIASVLSLTAFGDLAVKGMYGYNKRMIYTRNLDMFGTFRDVGANMLHLKWVGPVYYGFKALVWGLAKRVDYKDYTDYIIASDKANRNALLNMTTDELAKLDDVSEFFYSKSTYGYVRGLYNDDETLNRIVVAIDDIDRSENALATTTTTTTTDRYFTLDLPESIWKSLSEGKSPGEYVTLYAYNNVGKAVEVKYYVNDKDKINIPSSSVDAYLTLFMDVDDVVNEGKAAYVRDLHSAIVTTYGKLGDPELSEQKKTTALNLTFSDENSSLVKLLKVIDVVDADGEYVLDNMDLTILDAVLRDIQATYPIYNSDINAGTQLIEAEMVSRGISPNSIAEKTTEVAENIKNKIPTVDSKSIAKAVTSISLDVAKYEEEQNTVLTRDAIKRFLIQNFKDDAEITESVKRTETAETMELLKLSLIAFAKAQASKTLSLEKMAKIEVSFISMLLQPDTSGLLYKMSLPGAVTADCNFTEADIQKVVTSAQKLSDALEKVDGLVADKDANGIENMKYDLTKSETMEKLKADNPAFDNAYEAFKVDCKVVTGADVK